MLRSIDSCQNRVSADQYHLTVPQAQVSTHRGRLFFLKLSVDKLPVSNDRRLKFFFRWFIWNMLCLCHYGPALLRFWFQTGLGRENSASFLKIHAGKTFSYQRHALVTCCVQFLCSDCSKFYRWVHAENCCSILKVVYFDSLGWSLQSFVSTCDVFNCLFPLDVQNEIQLLSRVFCDSWLVCLFGFRLRNASRQNSVVRFRMASFLVFTLLDA